MYIPLKVKKWSIKDGAEDLCVQLKNARGEILGRAVFSLDEIADITKLDFYGYEVIFKNKQRYVISCSDIDKCFDIEVEDTNGGTNRN